jgi:hypothetical protein
MAAEKNCHIVINNRLSAASSETLAAKQENERFSHSSRASLVPASLFIARELWIRRTVSLVTRAPHREMAKDAEERSSARGEQLAQGARACSCMHRLQHGKRC